VEPFKKHRGIVAVLDRANVDTDQIIPKQFLKSILRTGFGESLFFDWRYLPDGGPNPDFSLNRPEFKGASILVVRNNFGCGSSREHAVWAVAQYGFRAVIAPWQMREGVRVPGFADIFRNNCVKNGLLTIEMAPEQVDTFFATVGRMPGAEATIDLERQVVELHAPGSPVLSFEIDPGVKDTFLQGLDDIGRTMLCTADVEAFEKRHDVQMHAG
jgi:3-isopropylmalate/(R)-2-methylmalate dehydratase small subunit